MTTPRRTAHLTPARAAWVADLLEDGRLPAKGTPAHQAFLRWRYVLESVDGLPPANSAAGQALLRLAGLSPSPEGEMPAAVKVPDYDRENAELARFRRKP